MIDPRDMTEAQLSAAIDRAYKRARMDDPEITREDETMRAMPAEAFCGCRMSIADVKRRIVADGERRR